VIDEQLEFRLTQYLDGTLPPEEAPALFDELAKNREAVATLDEYRKLDVLMSAQPAGIKWDALAEHISGHIDEEQHSRMRIGVFAAPLRIAIAAMVLLAVGVGTWIGVRDTTPPGVQPAGPIAKSDIQGPIIEIATGAVVAEIEIGPAAVAIDPGDETYWYAESRPQRVIIASGVDDRQDERPY
jgi:negative regulator of sigma E activity